MAVRTSGHGPDVVLFHAMLHVMLWEGWCDMNYIAAHTEGFEQLKATVRDYTPQYAATVCGISIDDILLAARWFATSGATSGRLAGTGFG